MSYNLKFNNGNFRILQITDIQEIYSVSPDTVNFLEALIKKSNPDFIVLTGDLIKGYSLTFSGENSQSKIMSTLSIILKPVIMSKIPFTVTFGNHDETKSASKEFLWNFFGLFDNFIGNNYTQDCIPVYSENGNNVKFCVYTFDTFEKQKDGSYPPVTKEQNDMYRRTRDSIKESTGDYVNALAFQHIPPVEIYDLLDEVSHAKKGAVEGARTFGKRYFKLPSYAEKNGGFMGENAASPDVKSGQLEAFKEKNDVIGLFFGHDHNNSFVLHDNGLDLGYTQGAGFNVYGPGINRAGRIFDIKENNTSSYSTFTITYKDVLGKKLSRPITNFVLTHSPSSVAVAKKQLKKVGIATAITFSAIQITKRILKHK